MNVPLEFRYSTTDWVDGWVARRFDQVSELFAPLTGTVVAVNDELESSPERINEDPYGDGWICDLELADPAQLDDLLTAGAYTALIEA